MKFAHALNLLGGFGIFCGSVLAADEPPFQPQQAPLERYEMIWKRSPFVVETKVVEESAGLAQRFALTGVAVIDGAPVAFLLDRSSLSRMILAPGRPAGEIELVSVDQQSNARNSSAVIRLGAEQASLRFDSESLNVTAEGVPMPANLTNGQQVAPAPMANTPQRNVAPSPAPPARVIRRTLIRTRE